MADTTKSLSVHIMEALKPILPKGVGFIMICGRSVEGDLDIICNMPDDMALAYLGEAMHIVEHEPAAILEPDTKQAN